MSAKAFAQTREIRFWGNNICADGKVCGPIKRTSTPMTI